MPFSARYLFCLILPPNQLLLLFAVCIALAGTLSIATEYEVLQEFEIPGSTPIAGLTETPAGNIYGVTVSGGAFGAGTVYELLPDGTIKTAHNFEGADGAAPSAELVALSDGSLWGTCAEGGAFGFGTLFRITAEGRFSTIIDFSGSSGSALGSVPAGLASHPNGLLYGLTQAGGTNGHGTIFTLDPRNQVFSTLLSFTGNSGAVPGRLPVGRLEISGDLLFGATKGGGGDDRGTVFQVSPNADHTVLAAFTGTVGSVPGDAPDSGPVFVDGSLYGVTEYGGSNGFGVLYRIILSPSPTFSVEHHFEDPTGSQPAGRLVPIGQAELLGTTSVGGSRGLGAIFRFSQTAGYSVVSEFSGRNTGLEGSIPRTSLTEMKDGKLYATTSAGGPANRGTVFCVSALSNQAETVANFTNAAGWYPNGNLSEGSQGERLFTLAGGGSEGTGLIGQVDTVDQYSPKWEIDPSVASQPIDGLTKVGSDFYGIANRDGATGRGAAFRISSDESVSKFSDFSSTIGDFVKGPLLRGVDGSFYGTALEGGLGGNGTVFKIDPAGRLSRLFSFTGTANLRPGRAPQGPLIQGPDGSLYGLTRYGGAEDSGVLFRIDPQGSYSIVAEFSKNGPREPRGGLSIAPDGAIFGTTSSGGNFGNGTLFRFDPQTSAIDHLVHFTDAIGQSPAGPLVFDGAETICGTLAEGALGYGAVFRVSRDDFSATRLVAFTGVSGLYPGIAFYSPRPGTELNTGLMVDPDGSLSGVAPAGGSGGGGVFFRVSLISPFERWKRDASIAIDTPQASDPDRDGIDLLLEYALGLSPTAFDGFAPKADFTQQGINFSVGLHRYPERNDVKITVEVAESPAGPWTQIAQSDRGEPFTGSATIEGDSGEQGPIPLKISYPTTLLPDSNLFMRIKASKP